MKKIKFFAAGLALVLAICSAFTIPPLKGGKQTNTIYKYISTDQSVTARETASNYQKGSATCPGSANECAVTLNQDFGMTPDFSNVTFDSNGFPDGGSAFVSNALKP